MQKHNVNLPIIVTGRHVEITEAIRDYAHKKIESLHRSATVGCTRSRPSLDRLFGPRPLH